MTLQPVESSNIAAVGHDPETNTLRVQFRSGQVYDYQDVPAEVHAALINASSIGSHLHNHIKGKHSFVKLEALPRK